MIVEEQVFRVSLYSLGILPTSSWLHYPDSCSRIYGGTRGSDRYHDVPICLLLRSWSDGQPSTHQAKIESLIQLPIEGVSIGTLNPLPRSPSSHTSEVPD